MRVVMTVLLAAAAVVGAGHAQSAPAPAPIPAPPVSRTELAPPNNSNNQTITHVCTEREDLSLTGSNNKVTLTGACHSLLIRGSGNKVGAEQLLDTVDVTGDNNAVTWPRSPGESHLNFQGSGNSAGAQKS